MNRLYKYSTFLLLIMTSGLLFVVVGLFDDYKIRYKIFEVFQLGTDQLFKLTDLKFNTAKDNTIWVSNYHIAPIVNLISSLIWTGITILVIRLITSQKMEDLNSKSDFWKRVLLTNLTLSFLFLLLWSLMDLDFIYSDSTSILTSIYSLFSFIAFFPAIVSNLFAALTLDNGGDTVHGYSDMYLISKTSTAFALTVWSIFGVYLYDKIIKYRANKKTKQISVDEYASR